MLASWGIVSLHALGIATILYGLGFVMARAWRPHTNFRVIVAQSPAWTLGLLAPLALALEQFDIAWGILPVIAAVIAVSAIGVVGTYVANVRTHLLPGWVRNPRSIPARVRGSQGDLRRRLSVTAMIGGTWLLVVAPLMMTATGTRPVQGGDSNYHYNQLWLIEHTHNASMLNANATMEGFAPDGWYYPNVWHALVALVCRGPLDIIAAANAMLLVIPLIWIISSVVLIRTWWHRDVTYGGAILASILTPVACMQLQLSTTLWPFVLGMTTVAGLIPALVRDIRQIVLFFRQYTYRHEVVRTLTLFPLSYVIPLCGIVSAHPSTLVPLGSSVFTLVLAYLIQSHRRIREHHSPRMGLYSMATIVGWVLLLVAVVKVPGPQSKYFLYYPTAAWDHIPHKLFGAFSLFSAEGGIPAIVFALVFAAILAASIVILWIRHQRVVLWCWLTQWILIIACYIPIPIISRVTSLYYTFPDRAKVACSIFAVVIVARGLAVMKDAAIEALRGRVPRLRGVAGPLATAVAVVVACAMVVPMTVTNTATSFHPGRDNGRFLADDDELAMIERARTTLPDDAVVLGDPASGASLLQAVSDVEVLYPYPNSPRDHAGRYINTAFNTIHWNDDICVLLASRGIKYFYADEPRVYSTTRTDRMRPGLYNVDTSTGFTLIDEGGSAKLYRIDVCSGEQRPNRSAMQALRLYHDEWINDKGIMMSRR